MTRVSWRSPLRISTRSAEAASGWASASVTRRRWIGWGSTETMSKPCRARSAAQDSRRAACQRPMIAPESLPARRPNGELRLAAVVAHASAIAFRSMLIAGDDPDARPGEVEIAQPDVTQVRLPRTRPRRRRRRGRGAASWRDQQRAAGGHRRETAIDAAAACASSKPARACHWTRPNTRTCRRDGGRYRCPRSSPRGCPRTPPGDADVGAVRDHAAVRSRTMLMSSSRVRSAWGRRPARRRPRSDARGAAGRGP